MQVSSAQTPSARSCSAARTLEARLLRLLRPGRPPPKGEFSAKSTCFWLSTRTMKDGMFTICLPTLRQDGAGGNEGEAAVRGAGPAARQCWGAPPAARIASSIFTPGP